MLLADFPRPSNDTGCGIHSSASVSYPLGENEGDYGWWLDEMEQMGVRWVKLLTGPDGNALAAARAILARGMMPIIRPYRPTPAPWGMFDRAPEFRQGLQILIDGGCKYIETDKNEPGLLSEWDGGWVGDGSSEWEQGAQPDRVAESWARDAYIIADMGGLPGLPPLAPGGNYNDVDFFRTMLLWLKQHGHTPLMQRGVWISLHNATLGHPLAYPSDPVNQQGVPVTQEEYDKHQWHGPISWVNAERVRGKNPGQHLLSVHPADHPLAGKDSGGSNCWRKYEAYEAIFEQAFGFQAPVLSTEGGIWEGAEHSPDPRYWISTVWDVSATTVEFSRAMMDGEYPPYYFCTCPWLIANRGMGNPYSLPPDGKLGGFEGQAFYSPWRDDGQQPVVQALKNMPKHARLPYIGTPEPPPVEPPVVIPPEGVVLTMLQILTYARAVGAEGDALVVAGAVGMAESLGYTRARGYNEWNDSQDLGVWQIQLPLHMWLFTTIEDAYDPEKNAHAMWEISEHGTKWTPWMMFTGGGYLKYMDEARAAALLLPAPEPSFEELVRFAYENCMGIAYTPGFAIMRAILADGLTVDSKEGRGTIACGPWVGQVAQGNGERVLYYTREGAWRPEDIKKRVIGRA